MPIGRLNSLPTCENPLPSYPRAIYKMLGGQTQIGLVLHTFFCECLYHTSPSISNVNNTVLVRWRTLQAKGTKKSHLSPS